MSNANLMRAAAAALAIAAGCLQAQAQVERKREVVVAGPARIDLISEGKGPLIVMLPSRGRDSEDFDDVAADLAKAG